MVDLDAAYAMMPADASDAPAAVSPRLIRMQEAWSGVSRPPQLWLAALRAPSLPGVGQKVTHITPDGGRISTETQLHTY